MKSRLGSAMVPQVGQESNDFTSPMAPSNAFENSARESICDRRSVIEAFNAFNHPSFGPPARDISVPNTFGQITSTISSPRVIELVAKFSF